MKPLLSLYPSHDSSMTVRTEDGQYRIFEFERLLKKRFARVDLIDNYRQVYNYVKSTLKSDYNLSEIKDLYCLHDNLSVEHGEFLKDLFGVENTLFNAHHLCHVACSFYQSPFEEALVISFDGGGLDGGYGADRVSYFNVYTANRNGDIKRLKYIPYDLGTAYGLVALPIKEINKTEEDWGEKFLGFAGKIMGLVAYGYPRSKWIGPLKEFYKQHKHVNPDDLKKTLSQQLNLSLDINSTEGNRSYKLAATSQAAFEEVFLDEMKDILATNKLPICLTGGCALNVILNQKLRDTLDVPVFVPPNPSDCGLSLGAMLLNNPAKEPVDITYSGFAILDREDLYKYANERGAKLVSTKDIAKLLSEGKIIGLMRGNSECGPRALGNRSILCDPSIANMKDTLNHKVKYREPYRPFAPLVKLEDVNKYFHMTDEAAFMSFSPKVKDEWKNKIPAVVHEDGTSRVQTVSEKQNPYIYQLLSDFEQIKNCGIILNTSFNIKGKPILTTIADALEVLDTTELDMVVIEDYLFSKNELNHE